MSFFYSSAAGAVDFWAMAAVAVIAVLAGKPVIRFLALVMVAAFVFDRALLAYVPAHLFPLLATAGCLLAVAVVTAFHRTGLALAFASLFLLKGFAALGLALGLSFFWAANAATAFVYFQMLLILGGTAHGMGGRLAGLRRNPSGFSDDRLGSGRHPLAGGVSISHASGVSFAGVAASAHRSAADRKAVT